MSITYIPTAQFKKSGDRAKAMTEYDFESVMHYSQRTPNSKDKPRFVVLKPVPAGVEIGQRTHLSELDALGVNKMYNCSPGEC